MIEESSGGGLPKMWKNIDGLQEKIYQFSNGTGIIKKGS